MKIGCFDSGLGGLTVFKEVTKAFSDFDYMYLGDVARAPYGSRSSEVIMTYTRECLEYLEQQGCSVIIVACNTASSEAVPLLRDEFASRGVIILGVLEPTASYAASLAKESIGVIATKQTIQGGAFKRLLQYDFRVTSVPTPLLVPFIEEGEAHTHPCYLVLKQYLRPLRHAHVDTVVLGCTHYPVLKKHVKKIMGSKVKVVTSAEAMVVSFQRFLHDHPTIVEQLSKQGRNVMYTTDCAQTFALRAKQLFGVSVGKAERIYLHK